MTDLKHVVFAPVTVSGMKQAAVVQGISSSTYVMVGLALTLTSIIATRVWTTFNGRLSNDTNGRETEVVICYGTGPPPANGDPQTGTVITQPASFVATSGGGSFLPFSLTATFSGIEPGTEYWFDLAMKVTGGIGTVDSVDASAMGLP